MASEPGRVWVDVETGTWGDAADIVFLTLTDQEVDDLDEMSDSDRCRFAMYKDAERLVAEAQRENPRR